jgi:alpha/beta superfamily hydrolase
MRHPEIANYILFAPPLKLKDFNHIVPCSSNGLIVYEADLPNSVPELSEKLTSKGETRIETLGLEGVHIEKNKKLNVMLDKLRDFFATKTGKDTEKVGKIKRDRRRRKKKRDNSLQDKTPSVSPVKSLDI